MRKTLSVLALALLASHAMADDTKSAIGGGVGGALGNVVGGALGGSTGCLLYTSPSPRDRG